MLIDCVATSCTSADSSSTSSSVNMVRLYEDGMTTSPRWAAAARISRSAAVCACDPACTLSVAPLSQHARRRMRCRPTFSTRSKSCLDGSPRSGTFVELFGRATWQRSRKAVCPSQLGLATLTPHEQEVLPAVSGHRVGTFTSVAAEHAVDDVLGCRIIGAEGRKGVDGADVDDEQNVLLLPPGLQELVLQLGLDFLDNASVLVHLRRRSGLGARAFGEELLRALLAERRDDDLLGQVLELLDQL